MPSLLILYRINPFSEPIMIPTRLAPFLLSAGFVISSVTGYAQNRDSRIKRLEGQLENILDLSDCPGMAVAVVEKDRIIYARGFGYRDYENREPADENTLFAIGSCTKAFTGSLIGRLESEGKIDFDASPRDYMPQLRFYNDDMNRLITIRDMLSHRTGLPRHDLSWYMFPSSSRDSLIHRIRYQEPTLAVREAYQYNNFMYMALGAMVESVSGQSWEQHIRDEIFAPLQMDRSTLHIDESEQTGNIAFGYSTRSGGEIVKDDFYHIRGMAPAGSINSSALEMGNWIITWINGGEYNGREVIPASYVREAMRSQVVASGGLPGSSHPDLHFDNYGFGWSLSSYRGHYRVEHGGNIDGFTASACFFPSDSIGIVVLVNQNYSGVPSLVRNIIADKLLGLDPGNWDQRLKERAEKKDGEEEGITTASDRIPGTRYSHELQDYTGRFRHPGYGTVSIELKDDSLRVILPERTWWLKHHHYDVFQPIEITEKGIDTTDNGPLRFNFRTDNRGELDGLTMNTESGLDPLFFERQPLEVMIGTADLEKYTGEYDLGGVAAVVAIESDGSLTLLVPGQPKYTLVPAGNHKFRLKDVDGYSVEFEESGETIEAIKFIQPNGTFRVPRK